MSYKVNQDRLVETLESDKDFLFLINYDFENMSFGPNPHTIKGLKHFWNTPGNHKSVIDNLVLSLPWSFDHVTACLDGPTVVAQPVIDNIAQTIKNGLFIAVCLDILINKYKTVDINGYSTKYNGERSSFNLGSYKIRMSNEFKKNIIIKVVPSVASMASYPMKQLVDNCILLFYIIDADKPVDVLYSGANSTLKDFSHMLTDAIKTNL